MEFNASAANLLNIKVDSLILLTGSQLQNTAKLLDDSLNGAIQALIKSGDFSGKLATSCILHTQGKASKRIILIGTDGAATTQKMIKVMESAASLLRKTPSQKALWIGDSFNDDHEWQASIMARSVQTSSYKYNGSSKPSKPNKLKSVTYWCAKKSQTVSAAKGLVYGNAVGNGMNTARGLADLPANFCTPNYLASQAKKVKQRPS